VTTQVTYRLPSLFASVQDKSPNLHTLERLEARKHGFGVNAVRGDGKWSRDISLKAHHVHLTLPSNDIPQDINLLLWVCLGLCYLLLLAGVAPVSCVYNYPII
jgi:hypothetical protein